MNLTFKEILELIISHKNFNKQNYDIIEKYYKSLKIEPQLVETRKHKLSPSQYNAFRMLFVLLMGKGFLILPEELLDSSIVDLALFYFLSNIIVITSDKSKAIIFDEFYKFDKGGNFIKMNGMSKPFFVTFDASRKVKCVQEPLLVDRPDSNPDLPHLIFDSNYDSFNYRNRLDVEKDLTAFNIPSLAGKISGKKSDGPVNPGSKYGTPLKMLNGRYSLEPIDSISSRFQESFPHQFVEVRDAKLIYKHGDFATSLVSSVQNISAFDLRCFRKHKVILKMIVEKLKLIKRHWMLVITPSISFLCFTLYFKTISGTAWDDNHLLYNEVGIANFYSITNFNMLFILESFEIRRKKRDLYYSALLGKPLFWSINIFLDYLIFVFQNIPRFLFLALSFDNQRFQGRSRKSSLFFKVYPGFWKLVHHEHLLDFTGLPRKDDDS